MKKLFLSTLISISLYAGIDGKQEIDYSIYDKIEISKILNFMANSVSKQIPMSIDELTTLIRCYSYSNTIHYIKQMDLTNDKKLRESFKNPESKKEFKVILYEQDKNLICSDKLIQYLLKNKGAIVEYEWVDSKSRKIFDYTVEYKDCLK